MDPNTIGIIVNIILCILSFILAAISVITVVITLKQNNKMLESSTRPYIAFRLESNQHGVPIAVLKNCGNSAATITKFSPSINFEDCAIDKNYVPFAHIENTCIFPGQSFITNFNPGTPTVNSFEIDITYKSDTHTYKENIVVNMDALREQLYTTPGIKTENSNVQIARALYCIDRKLLELK